MWKAGTESPGMYMCAAAAALTSWVIITLKWLVRQTCRDKTYIAYIVILFVESCLIATVVTSWTCFFLLDFWDLLICRPNCVSLWSVWMQMLARLIAGAVTWFAKD